MESDLNDFADWRNHEIAASEPPRERHEAGTCQQE